MRWVTQARWALLRPRIDDMQKMAHTRLRLIHEREHAGRLPRCPILAWIESPLKAAAKGRRAAA